MEFPSLREAQWFTIFSYVTYLVDISSMLARYTKANVSTNSFLLQIYSNLYVFTPKCLLVEQTLRIHKHDLLID